jgi:hypothetical protein
MLFESSPPATVGTLGFTPDFGRRSQLHVTTSMLTTTYPRNILTMCLVDDLEESESMKERDIE